MNILVIGPKMSKDKKNLGGVVVLFDSFLKYLRRENINHKVIDLNPSNYSGRLQFYMKIYFLFFIEIIFSKQHSVSFHGTARAFTYFAPFVVFLSKLSKKQVTLRKFGGSFKTYYDNCSCIKRILIKYALKNADTIFFETKYLKEDFKDFGKRVIWFPNVRSRYGHIGPHQYYRQRFVFISTVNESKGVTVFLESIKKINDKGYTFDIYGPKIAYEPPIQLKSVFDCSYKGILQPSEVYQTLCNYDILVLPTFHDGEGYPGIIIEAFSCGIPVISTYWSAIPEIVNNLENGVLCEPNSVEELVGAIKKINSSNYLALSRNALESFKNFDEDKVMKRIMKYL